MPLPRVGYCTNVHAGTSLEDVQTNLIRVAPSVRRQVCPEAPLGIGLWLPASALDSLRSEGARARFRDWLAEHALVPYTVNGFPYGDFHAAVVKHRVYEPDWRTDERVAYTIALAELVSACVPAGSTVPISTLPLGWATAFQARAERDAAARGMHRVVDAFAAIEDGTGTRIRLALEPEPGCALGRSEDVVRFTEEHLRPILGADRVARYTGVCHDVCHAAVLFEEQAEAMRTYGAGGVEVLKVQVSSAPRLAVPEGGRGAEGLQALRAFHEPRYLHQTCVRALSGDTTFYEDLPLALERAPRAGEWRVHFHVPVHMPVVAGLDTTQGDILRCLEALPASATPVFEVETYAWDVLPGSDRPPLASGIAAELAWFDAALSRAGRIP